MPLNAVHILGLHPGKQSTSVEYFLALGGLPYYWHGIACTVHNRVSWQLAGILLDNLMVVLSRLTYQF